jgi:hypothetical protein
VSFETAQNIADTARAARSCGSCFPDDGRPNPAAKDPGVTEAYERSALARATFASAWRRRRLTPQQRVARGKAARVVAPRSSHGEWAAPAGRADPVELLTRRDADRVPDLVPVRHARMAISPFTFDRGAAAIMAGDLASTPVSGVTVQLCGDAHLSNFGLFGTPERRMIFDVNDFDETYPGPGWDGKRLAASFEIGGRDRAFRARDRRAIVMESARAYRRQMRRTAGRGTLGAWYDHVDAERLPDEVWRHVGRGRLSKKEARSAESDIARPPTRDGVRVLARLFRFVHAARKAVGAGSVGTRCYILLLVGRDHRDPLFLQVKEAGPSVLEEHLRGPRYRTHGARVVIGQRVMQAATDVVLGWQRIRGLDGLHRDYHARQRDYDAFAAAVRSGRLATA